MSRRLETFTDKFGKISVEAYVGNGHGVHANKFPVNYEELFDIPEDILFRTNECIISSAYCRLIGKEELYSTEGLTLDQIIDRIANGLLWKKRQNLCHSDLAIKDSVITYLKYVGNSSLPIGVYSFDKLFEFEKEKTKNAINNNEELELYNSIINLNTIAEGYPLLMRLLDFEDSNFKKYALLLLKCKVYDIEDKHYMQSKKHDIGENESLKLYRKTVFPQW